MRKIQICTRLHDGIYPSAGGGETRVVAEYAYGPRNLVKAWERLQQVRHANRQHYGNVGCGHSWIQTTDGRVLYSLLADHDQDLPHAERVEAIEAALLTSAQQKQMMNYLQDSEK